MSELQIVGSLISHDYGLLEVQLSEFCLSGFDPYPNFRDFHYKYVLYIININESISLLEIKSSTCCKNYKKYFLLLLFFKYLLNLILFSFINLFTYFLVT